jgi:hypothetical protein
VSNQSLFLKNALVDSPKDGSHLFHYGLYQVVLDIGVFDEKGLTSINQPHRLLIIAEALDARRVPDRVTRGVGPAPSLLDGRWWVVEDGRVWRPATKLEGLR